MENDFNYQPQQPKKRLLLVIMLVVLIIIALTTYILYVAFSRKGKASVEIVLAPSIATILLDNGQTIRDGTVWLVPGDYKATASLDGFSSEQKSFSVPTENSEAVVFILGPNTAKGEEILKQHQNDYTKAEAASGENAQLYGEQFRETNPITDKLPFRASFYSIDYLNKDSKFAIQITASTPAGRQTAIEQIRTWGYEPSDFVIEFLQYTNPFERNP